MEKSQSEKLGVVLFGCGGIGRHHFRLLRGSSDLELLALVDPASAPMEGVRVFPNADEFLQAVAEGVLKLPDVAIVATPIHTHFGLAKKLLEQSVHVLVEKPLAPTTAECEELKMISQAKGKVLFVGHSERYNPAFASFLEVFRTGITGQLYRLESNRSGPYPQRVGDAGATIDLAVHDLECLSHILDNQAPQWVFARTEQRIHPSQEDGLNAMIGYNMDVLVQLTVNWLSPRKTRHLNVYGYKGMLQCDFDRQTVTFFENLYQRSKPDEYGFGGIEVGPEQHFLVDKWEPLAREHETFFSHVRGKKVAQGELALQSACLAVEIAGALLQSSKENRQLTWKPQGIPNG
jgi:predicted dehydrogenase